MDDGIKTLERLGFYFLVKSNDNGPARQVEVKTNLPKSVCQLNFGSKNRLFWREKQCQSSIHSNSRDGLTN